MGSHINPFPPDDLDRHEIWNILVARDIDAFVAADWAAHEADFLPDGFLGVDAGGSGNPENWSLGFPDLATYSKTWLGFARAAARTEYAEDLRLAHFRASNLDRIEVVGDVAIAQKKFDGTILRADGGIERLSWQTIYYCRRKGGRWWIAGFVGLLPNPMGEIGETADGLPRIVHFASRQHATAGPYSPVVAARPGRIVVISGQVAVSDDGSLAAEGFEDQAEAVLRNCERQLDAAECGLADVFKATIYLTDLANWPRFNDVYARLMPRPFPARTAVGPALLPGYQVEIDMWAVTR